MKSNPITRIAGTDYGSATVNQEVTVDAAGTIPAKFERMSPIKQSTESTDPIEEDVQDEGGNLQRGRAEFSFGPDKVNIIKGKEKKRTVLYSDLDPSIRDAARIFNLEKYGTLNPTAEGLADNTMGTGKFEEDTIIREQGKRLAQFAYTPQTREADTFTIRQSRKQDRDVRATKRRLDRAIKRGKDQGAIDALQAKYDRKLREQQQGINPYLTKRSKEDVQAPKGTQTKSQFESKYGITGFTGLTDFTPSKISFSNPTLPASNNVISDFSGNVTNIGNRAAGKKTATSAFKMKGYMSKYNK